MNISSEIFPTDGSNSSTYVFDSGTNVDFLFFLNVLVSFPTNVYVIWLIVTGTGNGLAAEFFSLNLSVCEIFICVESICLFLMKKLPAVMIVVSFLDGLATMGRPLFQSLICVERYLAVLHPVIFLKYKPLRYRLICCVFAWLATLVYSGISVIVVLLQPQLYFVFLFTEFFFFLSIQLFCCLSVLRALKQSGPGDGKREREQGNHMKRRAFYLILITTVTSCVIYAPYIVLMYFIGIFYTLLTVCSFLFILAGVVQPLFFLNGVRKLPFIKYQ